MLWHALPVMALVVRACGKFRGSGDMSYFYLKRRLEEWGQGYHSPPGSPMPMVASTLGPDEVEALASYLSFVK